MKQKNTPVSSQPILRDDKEIKGMAGKRKVIESDEVKEPIHKPASIFDRLKKKSAVPTPDKEEEKKKVPSKTEPKEKQPLESVKVDQEKKHIISLNQANNDIRKRAKVEEEPQHEENADVPDNEEQQQTEEKKVLFSNLY